MTTADVLFKQNCRKIIDEGFSDEGFHVRPKWHDGTPAHTKKILYVSDRYDLSLEPIPMITLRKQFFKSAVDEILWIYQKQTSDLSQLNSKVWNDWNVGDGTIGKAYGYQIGQLFRHHKCKREDIKELNSGFYGEYNVDDNDFVCLSQMGAVLWDLKHDPGSRRIMTNTYVHKDLADMGLSPCAYSIQFNVTKNGDDLVLNAILFQRSQDMLTANGWNVMQYAALVQMAAHVCGMKCGTFVHSIADCHIYDRHIPLVEEILSVDSEHENPGLWINPNIDNFFDFTTNDIKLIDYTYNDWNKPIEVAV